MAKLPEALKHRKADYPIETIFLKRWSPRALDPARPLSDAELNTLFEAARWAPSTYNEQEWRYLYARNGVPPDQHWQTFFDLLVPGNQAWCHLASVLVVMLSKKTFTKSGKLNPVHTFDTGASFENMALQAATMGIVVHGMAGFDRSKARTSLNVPDDYDVEAMAAIGWPGDVDELPPELREREVPSGRKKINEWARPGLFSF